jgi:hypothetical protein
MNSKRDGVVNRLRLSETIYAYLFFLVVTFLLLITSQGRIVYTMICLLGTPICFLWMHLSPATS